MSTEQIHLEKITWDNYDKICKLRVTKEQDEFVARNDRSLIHAYAALSQGDIKPFPFGIYLGKKPVGLVEVPEAYVEGEEMPAILKLLK